MAGRARGDLGEPVTPYGVRSLSVVLPARDEEGNIDAAVEAALGLARQIPCVEVVVVDDGSRARTHPRVVELASRDPRVRLLTHPEPRGYGAALRTGFHAARHDWIFFTDTDLQFDLTELGVLLRHAPHADLVAGWRAPRADPRPRRMLAAAWTLLAGGLLGLEVRDINCAFKLFRRSLLDGLALRSEGAFINAELLAGLRHRGARVVQVPVTHRPRRQGQARGGRLDVSVRAVAELIRRVPELRASGARPGGPPTSG